MSWSIGETRALVIKSARGAGMDWGMAQEAGFALEWLEKHGIEATKTFAQYLSHVDAQRLCTYENCPLKLGTLISDTGDFRKADGQKILAPLLLAPFLALSLEEQIIELSWNGTLVLVQKDNLFIKDPVKDDNAANTVSLKTSTQSFVPAVHKTRVDSSASPNVEILTRLAHKTYAPATEASRLAGAGAGLNDND